MAFPIVVGSLIFSKPGYELQKYVLPVAFRVSLPFGTHERGIGYDISYGWPKIIPFTERKDFGATNYKKSYGNWSGWQYRQGSETSYLLYTSSKTEYFAGELSQVVGRKSYGIPSVIGIDISNDLWGDRGDRYRTSSQTINLGLFRIGNLLYTGDPGPSGLREIQYLGGDPHGTYVANPYGDPDNYRHGILYGGIGPLEFGIDSEVIRDAIQNTLHNIIKSPHFKNLRRTNEFKKDKFYFQYGWSGW